MKDEDFSSWEDHYFAYLNARAQKFKEDMEKEMIEHPENTGQAFKKEQYEKLDNIWYGNIMNALKKGVKTDSVEEFEDDFGSLVKV